MSGAGGTRQAHDGQRRKYNDRPYIQHPARVAGRVAARPQATEVMAAAAFLHDVVEDTPHTLDEILAEFGPEVARLVAELTNPSNGSKAPRRERERIDRDHLAVVSVEAKVIRLRAASGAFKAFADHTLDFSTSDQPCHQPADEEIVGKKTTRDCPRPRKESAAPKFYVQSGPIRLILDAATAEETAVKKFQ